MLLALLRVLRPRLPGSLVLAAVAIVLQFSLRQEENFTWGFQVAFVGVFALATFAFSCFSLALAGQRRGAAFVLPLVGAWAGVAVATFTLANGLLTGIVLVILGLVASVRSRLVALTAALTVALAAAYLYGYEPNPDHTSLGQALSRPVRFGTYILVYLGNLLDPHVRQAAALGAVGFVAAALLLWRCGSGRGRHPARLARLGILLFTVGTDVITALLRVGFGVDQAMASRYATVSGLFWSALLISYWSLAGSRIYGPAVRGGVVLFSAILLFGACRAQQDDKPGMEDRAYVLAESRDALLLGLEDLEVFGGVYNPPELLKT